MQMKKFRQGNVERSRVGALTKGYDAPDVEGAMAKFRADRPMRAAGGKVKRPTTVVNVITGGQQQPPAPPPMPMPMPPPGAMPPGPPPGPPPGAMPPPGAGPAGPMAGGPPPMPMRARGGGVKSIGMDVGTKVQPSAANTDPKNMNRKRVVTFATGGGVVSFKARGGPVKGVVMQGGTPKTASPVSDLPGGAGGGKGRLAKIRKY